MEFTEQVVNDIAYEVKKSRGWMKFLGIVMIISGALSALSIVGIVFAWLPIWMGVLLTQAAGYAEKFANLKDANALKTMLSKLRVFFLIQGIVLIVSIVITVLVIVFYIIFGIAMLGIIGQNYSY